jgi:membrane fusion protein (multidrug efflux system)
MKRIFRSLLIGLMAVLLGLAQAACGDSQPPANAREKKETSPKAPEAQPGPKAKTEPEAKIVRVGVQLVAPTAIRDALVLPGETRPHKDVALAADQDGRVEWVGPKEGDQVKTGDLVAKVDVSALKAALDNAQASTRLAEELFQRRKVLFQRKIISQEELDQARTELAVQQGLVRQAKAKYDLGFIHTPIDAVVNKVYVDPGEFVARGGKVMDLVNVDRIEIGVNVPEMDVRYLAPGAQALVRVDALPDHQAVGVVDSVAYKADTATRTFAVKVLVDNTDRTIRPGMIARVFFLKRTIPDALAAPLFALVDQNGERLLYVVENGVAKARPVEIGVIELDRVQITKGLQPGDQLIVTGQKEVQEGTRVEIQ